MWNRFADLAVMLAVVVISGSLKAAEEKPIQPAKK